MNRKLLMLAMAMILIIPAFAQDKVISGKILNPDGQPAPGVSVLVKGTTIGTASDNDGAYSLSVPSGDNTLIFSFIGLKTVEVEIGNRTVVDVTMETDVTELTEVVVVGYGTQLKQDLTGNV